MPAKHALSPADLAARLEAIAADRKVIKSPSDRAGLREAASVIKGLVGFTRILASYDCAEVNGPDKTCGKCSVCLAAEYLRTIGDR